MKVVNKIVFVVASLLLVASVLVVIFTRQSLIRFEAPGWYLYYIGRVVEYASLAVLWFNHFYMVFKQKDMKKEEEMAEGDEA